MLLDFNNLSFFTFTEHLLNTCYMQATVLNTEESKVNKIPTFSKLVFQHRYLLHQDLLGFYVKFQINPTTSHAYCVRACREESQNVHFFKVVIVENIIVMTCIYAFSVIGVSWDARPRILKHLTCKPRLAKSAKLKYHHLCKLPLL